MAQSDLTRIASNIAGLNALNALKDINTKLGIHQLRLSTGKRINQAADDPAGLTIGIKFNARSRGLGVAIDNIGDAKNLLSVGEGGLSKINDILLTIREKVAQAASDSLGADERTAIKSQIASLLNEIDTIAQETQWNKQKLLTGEITGLKELIFQTGSEAGEVTRFGLATDHRVSGLKIDVNQEYAGGLTSNVTNIKLSNAAKFSDVLAAGRYTVEVNYDGTTYTVNVKDTTGNPVGTVTGAVDEPNGTITLTNAAKNIIINATGIPATSGIATYEIEVTSDGVSGAGGARGYLQAIDSAIKSISESITSIGALVSRLTSKEEALTIAKTNTEAAYNRIMNADMAAEQLEAMKLSILQQTATAMLAQANVAPQAVLSLFR